MGMLERAQQITRQRMYHRNRSGASLQRTLEPLAIDPVAHAERNLSYHTRIVHVPDGGMVQPAERLGLADEPGAGGLIAIEVDPQAHSPSQDQVVRLEE